jgi:hypothetical protein
MRRGISDVGKTLPLLSVGIGLRYSLRLYPSFCGGILVGRCTLSVVDIGMDIGLLLGRRRVVGSSAGAMLLVVDELEGLTSVSRNL